MTLQNKTLIIVGLTFLATVALLFGITQFFILRSFTKLENSYVRTNVKRVINAVNDDLAGLKMTCSDWAAWEATYNFVDDQNADYIKENFSNNYLATLDLDFMIFFNNKGEMVYSAGMDRRKQQARPVQKSILAFFRNSHDLLKHRSTRDAKVDLVARPDGILYFSSCPISKNNFQSDIHGTLIAGRIVSDDDLKKLKKRTQLDVSMQNLAVNKLDSLKADHALTLRSGQVLINKPDETHIQGRIIQNDFHQQPAVLLGVETTRDIYQHGISAVYYFLVTFVVAGLIILLVHFTVMKVFVLRPIDNFKEHVIQISKNDNLTAEYRVVGNDEISILATEFNTLTRKLDAIIQDNINTHKRMLQVARTAGMVEVTSGFIHNIGNVINSLNVDVLMLEESLQKINTDNLGKASDKLKGEETPSPGEIAATKEEVVTYIVKMAQFLHQAQQNNLKTIENLKNNIDHLISIIHMQQDLSSTLDFNEICHLEDLLSYATEISRSTQPGYQDITLSKDYRYLPDILVDKHRFLQIVVNLLNNALYAVSIVKKEKKEVILRTEQVPGNIVRIEVIDNGVGIPPADLNSVFNQGFTTKKDGHGYGLHASANMAKEMNGSLRAFSMGEGKGATFILEIPVAVKGHIS